MDLGKRIRIIRKEQKRSQEEIAKACGFSKSLLSKIESGSTMPAVATLMKIANALGVKVSDLLEVQSGLDTVKVSATQYADTANWITTSKGYSFFAFASGRHNKILQPYIFIARKGEVKNHVFSHEGEEFIYVLSGKMKYKVGSVEYDMSAGDSLHFNSMEEHAVTALSDEVKYLAVFTEHQPRTDAAVEE
ncbi:helix-turn-helix domain-containing protein [Paenibacillus xerothermodurans]|uniref:XRE family transcriptional regulator n=1 Tax=Paenibacillus xerothermodurans TaxID=1977292 RepID=A0A2W1N749_PAEXE|nr:XRE family transcriptional regulator [Paenibacillus xerothermodurans]PZE19654.1 XRE family transcriptional regulator [Paenibacillus xerothermodurans]